MTKVCMEKKDDRNDWRKKMHLLEREFYLRDTLTVAKDLLGKYLVHEQNGVLIVGRITETEAYIAAIDKACHAYDGKVTPRTQVLYAQGGTAYVYLIYGMYDCMNVVTEAEGVAAAVLLRGVELVGGIEEAAHLRYGKAYGELTKLQIKNFSNGLGKLCKAMGITREQNKEDLCGGSFYITDGYENHGPKEFSIQTGTRIGIEYAEEAKDFMWRFYI